MPNNHQFSSLFSNIFQIVRNELGPVRYSNKTTQPGIITPSDKAYFDINIEETALIPTNLWGKYITRLDIIQFTEKTILNLEGTYSLEQLISENQNRALCAIVHEIVHSYRPMETINSISDTDIMEGIVEIIARYITISFNYRRLGLDTYQAYYEKAQSYLESLNISKDNIKEIICHYLNDDFPAEK